MSPVSGVLVHLAKEGLAAHVGRLPEAEHLAQHDVKGGHVIAVTATVSEHRLLIKTTSGVLGADRIDAGLKSVDYLISGICLSIHLCEHTLEPGQHQPGLYPLRGEDDGRAKADHVLERVVLVLPSVKVVEHLGVGEGGGGEVAACHRPGHHAGALRLCEPGAKVTPGEPVVNLQPDEAPELLEGGLDNDGTVTMQLGVSDMTGPPLTNSIQTLSS